MERKCVVKQEKGNDIYSVALKIAKIVANDADIDFADRNGWCDDGIYDTNLVDRYWEVQIIENDSINIASTQADYRFEIENSGVEVCLTELFLIP